MTVCVSPVACRPHDSWYFVLLPAISAVPGSGSAGHCPFHPCLWSERRDTGMCYLMRENFHLIYPRNDPPGQVFITPILQTSRLGLRQPTTCLLTSETSCGMAHPLFTLETFPLCAFKDFAITFVCVIFYSVSRRTRKWEGSSPSSIPSLGLPTPKKTR